MKKVLFLMLLLPVFAWAEQSPFDGTWKVDLNTAKFPDKPTVILLQDGRFQIPSAVPKINVKADGTDQPVPGSKDLDTLAVKVVNDRMVETVGKKDGRVVESSRSTVSPDGKTSTVEYTEYPLASKQPITAKESYIRVAAGPSGSHASSGSWRIQKVEASENALTFTYKSTGDGLMYSDSTGELFDGKFDGKDYPIKGVPPGITVSMTKADDRSIVSTIKQDGKIVSVIHDTVSANGKTMSIRRENKVQGTTTTYTAVKQ